MNFDRIGKVIFSAVCLVVLAFIVIGGIIYPTTRTEPYRYTYDDLVLACKNNDAKTTRAVLEQGFVYPNTTTEDGSAVLHIACEHGCFEVVELLLADRRVDPNGKDVYGKTPIHRAAARAHTEVVKFLLADERVDPNIADEKGRTPFQKACMVGDTCAEIVRLLLADERVLIDTVDIYGHTPRDWAMKHKELMDLIKKSPRVHT